MKIGKIYFLFVNKPRDNWLIYMAYVKVKSMTVIAQRRGGNN